MLPLLKMASKEEEMGHYDALYSFTLINTRENVEQNLHHARGYYESLL